RDCATPHSQVIVQQQQQRRCHHASHHHAPHVTSCVQSMLGAGRDDVSAYGVNTPTFLNLWVTLCGVVTSARTA
ncbi:unnamed protein product, partial [Lampetra fluviatilis]